VRMHLLVINSGSSSIKFSIFAARVRTKRGEAVALPASLFEGEVSGIGSDAARFRFRDAAGEDLTGGVSSVNAESSMEAIGRVVKAVSGEKMPRVDAVGYRVVHPGAKLDRHVRITDEVMRDLEEAAVFAPLHDPPATEIVRETMERFPEAKHYAVFDTVFHETMPEEAVAYAIPEEFRERGVRRYGFHGLSCESIVRQMLDAAERGEMKFPRRMVIAHLGSGCSVTALMKGTRPGDLDPGLVLYLLRQMKGDREAAFAEVERVLNRDSGMVGLSGLPNDMRKVREAAAGGDARAVLAAEVFTRSVKKAVGGFVALMGGLDALVFSGGIGEHDAQSRAEIAGGLDKLGISIDSALNMTTGDGLRRISASESNTAVFVVPSQEDVMIAAHVDRMSRAGL
jgi:acetate kinase